MTSVKVRGTWTRLTSGSGDPLKRSSHCCAVLRDTLYAFSGEVEPRKPVPNTLHALSLVTAGERDWTVSDQTHDDPKIAPCPRVGAACAAYGHDTLFVWGGRGGKDMSQPLAENGIWRYSPGAHWSFLQTTGDAPQHRSYHTLTADVARQRLYLHAGCPSSGRTGALHQLDLSTATWTKLPDAPGPGRGGTVLIRLHDGKLARFGGFAGHELAGLDIFDPDTQKWSANVDSDGVQPKARSVYSFIALDSPVSSTADSKIVALLALGEREGAPAHLGHAGAGNFHSDAWALLQKDGRGQYEWREIDTGSSEGPDARGWAATGAWQNKLVVHGGLNTQNERLGDAWALSLA